jgi:hypothetical protein
MKNPAHNGENPLTKGRQVDNAVGSSFIPRPQKRKNIYFQERAVRQNPVTTERKSESKILEI